MKGQPWRESRAAVRRLIAAHRCFMMKISTEDEALTHDDVRERARLFGPLIPLELKIGGPGARGDLALARELGIARVIAPMVESGYGMHDYVNGVKEIFRSGKGRIEVGVNIETAAAVRNLGVILDQGADILTQVTVGRSDLSKSMGCGVDDAPVTRATRAVVTAARQRGLRTFVGGGITPENAGRILDLSGADCVNTRNFAFRRAGAARLAAAVRHALALEIVLLAEDGSERALRRIPALLGRMSERDRASLAPRFSRALDRIAEAFPC